MKNYFHQIIHIVCIIAALGIGSSLACSGERIKACNRHVERFQHLDSPTPEVCGAVDKVIVCFKRETASCPPELKGTMDQAVKMFEQASEMCKNPDASAGTSGLDGIESCDHNKLERCMADAQAMADGQNLEAACRSLSSARECLDDFTAACKSDLFVGMVSSPKKMLEEQEQNCRSMGYSLGSGTEVDLTEMENCDTESFEKCARDFKNSAAAAAAAGNQAEGCRTLGDARKCMTDFKTGCKSTYFISLVDSQMEVIEDAEDICLSGGYAVGSPIESSSSSSSSQSESQSGSGSGTNRNRNDNTSKDGGGGCGSVQPTFFTLAASCTAMLAAYRLFL